MEPLNVHSVIVRHEPGKIVEQVPFPVIGGIIVQQFKRMGGAGRIVRGNLVYHAAAAAAIPTARRKSERGVVQLDSLLEGRVGEEIAGEDGGRRRRHEVDRCGEVVNHQDASGELRSSRDQREAHPHGIGRY